MEPHNHSNETVISVKHVSKTFKLPHERTSSIKNAFVHFYKRHRTYELQRTLTDISIDIKKGEFFGIVGRNGSGKSTLLKLLAGIYAPSRGEIHVKGKLTPFIELGVGFNPELTGRENVYLNGALLGFNHTEVNKMYKDIVDFAELEKFMDQKLKNYSSGMQVRLAFSIAIRAQSDILLLDEVLAVGDAAFQKKCFDYFRKLKKNKQTVVFISHDMSAVKEYCDRAILIDNGKIVAEGSPEIVAGKYTRLFIDKSFTDSEREEKDEGRWGSGKATIKRVTTEVRDKDIQINVEATFNEAATEPIIGITVFNPIGLKVFESNTKWARIKTGNRKAGDKFTTTFTFPNYLTNGKHLISAAVAERDAVEFFDWWDEANSFTINRVGTTTALIMPEHSVDFREGFAGK